MSAKRRKASKSRKQTTKTKSAKKRAAAQKRTRSPLGGIDPEWWLERLSRDHLMELSAHIGVVTGVEAAETCPSHVVRTIEQWGGGHVNSGNETLQQLSIQQPCSQGRVEDLRERLGCRRSFPMTCSSTVGYIIGQCCG